MGNILTIGDGVAPSKSRSFTYDSLNRLSSGTGAWCSGAGCTLNWSYDGVGNRQAQSLPEENENISYFYGNGAGENNKLHHETITRDSLNYARGYTHDANGNITQVTFPRVVTDYIYNADNRLVEVKKNNVTIATYVYDYQGRRIKKTAGGVETIYLYDLFGNLIYEYNKTANKTSEHVYLGSERIARIDNSNPVIAALPWYEIPKQRNAFAGIISFGFVFVVFFGIAFYKKGDKKYLIICLIGLGCLGAAGVLGFLVLPTTAHGQGTGDDVVYYYHNDHLGTPMKMTDAGGAVVWAADYLPFGKVQIDPSSTIINNFRFPGQYYDEETGLYYNWNRYYDIALGRYLQPDPIKKSPLYIYAENNCIIKVDPFGLITWHCRASEGNNFIQGGAGHEWICSDGKCAGLWPATWLEKSGWDVGMVYDDSNLDPLKIPQIRNACHIEYSDTKGGCCEKNQSKFDDCMSKIVSDNIGGRYVYIHGIRDCQWWANKQIDICKKKTCKK